MYAYYNQNEYTDNLRLATNNAHVHSVFDVQESECKMSQSRDF